MQCTGKLNSRFISFLNVIVFLISAMPEVDILTSLRNLSFDLPVEVDLEAQIHSIIGGPVVAQLLGYLNIDKECQITIIAILAGRGPSFTFDPILRACNKGMHGLSLNNFFLREELGIRVVAAIKFPKENTRV